MMMTRLRRWLPEPPADATPVERRTTTVFVVTIILLIVFQYFGKPESSRGALAATFQPIYVALLGSRADMAPYAHWGVSSIVMRVLIPFAIILFVFREPLANYGWRWRGTPTASARACRCSSTPAMPSTSTTRNWSTAA